MPNWCENHITIVGNEKSIKALSDVKLSLEELLPIPNGKDWYSWCNENWGTKWDINIFSFESTEDEIRAVFSSAWTPPIEAFKHIIKKYPDLEIDLKYNESGMGFVGRTYITEDFFENECESYNNSQEFEYAIGILGTREFNDDLKLMRNYELENAE